MNTKPFPLSSARFAWGKVLMRSASVLGIMAVASLGACKPKAVEQTAVPETAVQSSASTPQDAAPPAANQEAAVARAAPAPTKADNKDDGAAGGKAAGIAGGWVNAGGACDSGASVQFNADGTYMSEGENGTWALDGKTLTVTTSETPEAEKVATQGPEQSTGDSGEKAILTVLSVTDHSASVILSNGSNANWTRCSG
jgi:hypothetical protein